MSSRRLNQAKIVVLGGPSVGKSAFVVRYITKRFIGEYEPNTENLYTHKVKSHRDDEVTLTIIDTASQCDEATLRSHLETRDGVVLVYSIVDRSSLHEAHAIRAAYLNDREPSDPLVVVGNKGDLADVRNVSTAEGDELANLLECPNYEISVAESADGVMECMDELLRQIMREYVKAQNSLVPPISCDGGKRSKLMNMKNALKRRIGRSKSDTLGMFGPR